MLKAAHCFLCGSTNTGCHLIPISLVMNISRYIYGNIFTVSVLPSQVAKRTQTHLSDVNITAQFSNYPCPSVAFFSSSHRLLNCGTNVFCWSNKGSVPVWTGLRKHCMSWGKYCKSLQVNNTNVIWLANRGAVCRLCQVFDWVRNCVDVMRGWQLPVASRFHWILFLLVTTARLLRARMTTENLIMDNKNN